MAGIHNLTNFEPSPDMEGDRPGWDEYFIGVAEAISKRATCPRASVGAVLVKDHRIIATGYNGSLPNEPHCLSDGCLLTDGRHCHRVIHAEANVIYQAAKFGINTHGSTMYFWDSRERGSPCDSCMPAIISAGVTYVVNRALEGSYVNDYATHM